MPGTVLDAAKTQEKEACLVLPKELTLLALSHFSHI